MALAKGSHQFLELGRTLNLEEDFVVVVGDLDVEMLEVGGSLACTVVVRHFIVGYELRFSCGFLAWLLSGFFNTRDSVGKGHGNLRQWLVDRVKFNVGCWLREELGLGRETKRRCGELGL